MSAPMNIQHRRTPSTTFYIPQPTHARSLSSQFGSSWSDGFEFTSCSPLTSALHLGTSPPTNNTYMPTSCAPFSMSCSPRADYFSFERDYCSNFACCGITLPDMHALVAHFEETHLGGTDGASSMRHHHELGQHHGFSMSHAKPTQQIITDTNGDYGLNLVPGPAVGDAPSPNSSIGPETPPPASHIGSHGFSGAGQPHLQVETQFYGSRAISTSPYPHSPFSAGSPASSGVSEGSGSQSCSNSGEMDIDMDVDVLMAFDPLDNTVHTPLDSTPPSPLAHPIRPSSVLRAAALKNSGSQIDTPSVGLPPSLFIAPAPSPLGLSDKERRDRKNREKEKRNQSESSAVAADEASSSSSNAGGVVRRDKNRKAVSGSLLGFGLGPTLSRSSISSSSDDASSSGEGSGAEKDQGKKLVAKPEKVYRTERAERTGRPERPDKSGKRTREKAYKCPKPGCTKSYLNPNGLKYHTLKGTCTFANGSTPPTPVTPTTPALPRITVPSAPPVASLSLASKQAIDNMSNHPLTPTSLPSSPIVDGTQSYEYARQHQVPIIAEPVPREAAPAAFMYAPSRMC